MNHMRPSWTSPSCRHRWLDRLPELSVNLKVIRFQFPHQFFELGGKPHWWSVRKTVSIGEHHAVALEDTKTEPRIYHHSSTILQCDCLDRPSLASRVKFDGSFPPPSTVASKRQSDFRSSVGSLFQSDLTCAPERKYHNKPKLFDGFNIFMTNKKRV